MLPIDILERTKTGPLTDAERSVLRDLIHPRTFAASLNAHPLISTLNSTLNVVETSLPLVELKEKLLTIPSTICSRITKKKDKVIYSGPAKDMKKLTIYDIKRLSYNHSPYYFDSKSMKFFKQTLKDFKVKKEIDGRYKSEAPIKNNYYKVIGQSIRFFNPLNNHLEIN